MTAVMNGKKANENNFYMYTGSLTKPPCDEGVQWFIMYYPAEMSS